MKPTYTYPNYRGPAPSPRDNRKLYHNMKRKELIFLIAAVLVGAALAIFFWNHHRTAQASKTAVSTSTTVRDNFDKKRYSLVDPSSIWIVANKKHQLSPTDYTPADLRKPAITLRVPNDESMQVRDETATALEHLVAGAKTDSLNLMLTSGYRSYNYQVSVYNGYVKQMGQAETDRTSARPGYSEHQTGFAADLEPTNGTCELQVCFGDTPEGKWLAANAYKYGFIIRYPADKVPITGYDYEPWHVRYVGVALSNQMHKDGIETLEEFFDVAGGDYK